MTKKILTILILAGALIGTGIFAGSNLEAGLERIQKVRTYQEFYELPDWYSWTAGEKANHITAKVFDMEKDYNAQLVQLKAESQALKSEIETLKASNIKAQTENRQLLLQIVLLLKSK